MPRGRATWRCCIGRARTALRGTSDLRLCRAWRPPGGAAVGARERLPVGREDLPYAANGGHLEVLQWARANGCSVGRGYLHACRERRPPGGAAVGARERLLRGTRGLAPMPRKAATWRCCSGRARTALRGTSGLAAMPRKAATWRCCSGRERTAAPWDEMDLPRCRERRPPGGATVGASERLLRGTSGLAPEPRKAATWRCCSGRARTALRGTSGLAAMPRKAATWRCCSGRERTALRGTSGLAAMPRKAATWRCYSGRERTVVRGTSGLAPSRGRRPPGGAAVGARERRSVGREDLPRCRGRRPPGGAAVGASERRSVGRVDLPRCRGRRPPGGATVGASERRSVERGDLPQAAEGGHLEVLQWARANGAPE